MFKEFGVAFIIILFVFFVLKWLKEKNIYLFIQVLNGSLILCVIASFNYNIKNIFPNYNYENVSIGDCKENLFTYKSDSQFQWQVLFPILQNRNVQIYDVNGTYTTFMDLYAKEVQQVEMEPQIKEKIEREKEWSLNHVELSMFLELDYIFPEYYFDYQKGFPMLQIRYDELRGNDQLVAYVDKDDNLYLMSKVYFESIR